MRDALIVGVSKCCEILRLLHVNSKYDGDYDSWNNKADKEDTKKQVATFHTFSLCFRVTINAWSWLSLGCHNGCMVLSVADTRVNAATMVTNAATMVTSMRMMSVDLTRNFKAFFRSCVGRTKGLRTSGLTAKRVVETLVNWRMGTAVKFARFDYSFLCHLNHDHLRLHHLRLHHLRLHHLLSCHLRVHLLLRIGLHHWLLSHHLHLLLWMNVLLHGLLVHLHLALVHLDCLVVTNWSELHCAVLIHRMPLHLVRSIIAIFCFHAILLVLKRIYYNFLNFI